MQFAQEKAETLPLERPRYIHRADHWPSAPMIGGCQQHPPLGIWHMAERKYRLSLSSLPSPFNNRPRTVLLLGRNGFTSDFGSNITAPEVDAHCELMRQRVAARGSRWLGPGKGNRGRVECLSGHGREDEGADTQATLVGATGC